MGLETIPGEPFYHQHSAMFDQIAFQTNKNPSANTLVNLIE